MTPFRQLGNDVDPLGDAPAPRHAIESDEEEDEYGGSFIDDGEDEDHRHEGRDIGHLIDHELEDGPIELSDDEDEDGEGDQSIRFMGFGRRRQAPIVLSDDESYDGDRYDRYDVDDGDEDGDEE